MTTIKQTLIQIERNEEPHPPTQAHGLWAALAVSWDATVEYLLPIGYQDGSGFHYGTPTVLEDSLPENSRDVSYQCSRM